MSGAALWAVTVGLGGIGAALRYLVDVWVDRLAGGRFPAGTAAVNLTGALALGVLAGAAAPHAVTMAWGVGLLGGYTTFSTWMWESLLLAEDGRGRALLANVAGQLVLGLAAAAAGWALGAAL